jgi:4-hydroxy-tetrahydrodipicolinate reductase
MPRTVKVAVVGLGSVGQAVTRLLLQTPTVKVVGVADPAPSSAGKDLGTALGLPRRLRIKVDADPERFVRKLAADAAVVCTSSLLKEVKPQILGLVSRRIRVLTTCEELAFPVPPRVAGAREIARAAKAKKVAVLAAGLNPGFTMDSLALTLTAPCTGVRRVSVTRVQDAGTRRLPLQRRVGAGLNLGQFRRAVTEGTVRHVGLVESAHMIASALGWKLDRVDETLEPAIAPRDLDTEYLRIPAGAAAGIRQAVRGFRKGELAVSLDLQVYVGAEAPRDHILIDADPPVDATVAGGISGEVAAAAILVNNLPRLLAAAPGLATVKDLPLLHALNPHDLAPASPAGRR